MSENLESQWLSLLRAGELATREVDATAALRMVYGVDAFANPLFMIITTQKPGLPRLSGAISVQRRYRALDDRWTLTLVLNDPRLHDVFVALAVDLVSHCTTQPSEQAALETYFETVEAWQKLLRSNTRRLSEEALRGLIAELWVGFVHRTHTHSLRDAVKAWGGPYGAHQDFTFPANTGVMEVKALRPNRGLVTITSEHQLDLADMTLAVVTLDWATSDQEHLTLSGLVAAIRQQLEDPETRSSFDHALSHLDVDLDDPWYVDQLFRVTALRAYRVQDDFPAIRASALPEALRRTNYILDLGEVNDHLVLDEEISEIWECREP